MEAKIDYIIEIACNDAELRSLSMDIPWPWGEDEFEGAPSVPLILAKLDGISPPTGQALKETLERYHGKFTDKPVRFQVIRW